MTRVGIFEYTDTFYNW